MATFFTADTHFEHANLIDKMGRIGFSSIEEHDAEVIENINLTVGRGDALIIAGDFAWKNPQKWRQQIRCKHIRFALGNHDRPDASRKAFGEASLIMEVKTEALGKVIVSHYPIAFWPRCHHGAYHVYGHTHRQKEAALDKAFPQRRSIDIGIDNAIHLLGVARPFGESEVLELLRGREGHDPVTQYHLGAKDATNLPAD